MDKPSYVHGAAERAVEDGDAEGLRAHLNSREGASISRSYIMLPTLAAMMGDTHCLRVLAECGFALCTTVWECTAEMGQVNCLVFAVSHGYTLEDSVLQEAVLFGRLACVDLLLQQGLPREPFVHSAFRPSPCQLECLQLMLDKGVAINPKTLILAAAHGDVDFVRWLHQRGVPLWRDARDAKNKPRDWVPGYPEISGDRIIHQYIYQWQTVEGQPEPPGTIAIPWESVAAPAGTTDSTWHPCALEDTWKALKYGAVFGAPVTCRVERVFAKKRERTHAVLLCFKAAEPLRRGPGRAKQRRVWAGMAALPSCLVEDLLILADLEIPESVLRRLPLTAPATAR